MSSTAVSSCVGVCEYCGHEGEGWRSEADCFYCEACWAAYDAQLPKDMPEYPGRSLHDEIINSVQQESDDEGAGRHAEWLDAQYQKMRSQPIPPIEDQADAGSGKDGSDDEVENEPVAPLRTPAQKQEAPSAAHIILLIDTSGSMRTTDMDPQDNAGENLTRIAAVHEALRTLLSQQRVGSPGDIFSLVSFNDRSKVHFAAFPASAAEKSVGSEQIPLAQHGTTFEVGLDAVAELAGRFSGARTTHLVILSDGRPASAERTLGRAQALLSDQPRLRIHAIGFGGSLHSFELLQQLTSISGGMFAASSLSLSALKFAMSSVSSTITETQTHSSVFSFDATAGATHQPQQGSSPELRVVNFEPAAQFFFGAHRSLTMKCSRSWLVYDGCGFQHRTYRASRPYEVSLRLRPFTKGGMRLVYCFRDPTIPRTSELGKDSMVMCAAGTDARMVAKLSKYVDAYHNSEEVVSAYSRSSAVAQFYARMFMLAAASKMGTRGCARIIFVECWVYRVVGGDQCPAPFMIGERFLPGDFVKYNSNAGYVNSEAPDTEVAQAFSHFTYNMSRGKLIVVDLQGVYLDKKHRRRPHLIFTDSQVVSKERCFGPGDLGVRGLSAFFRNHQCGPTCTELGLRSGPGAVAPPPPPYPPPPRHVVCEVKPHFTKPCAILDLEGSAARQSILKQGPIATIAGVKVKISPFVDFKTEKEVPHRLFVTWGKQSLEPSALKAFFNGQGSKPPALEDQDKSPRIKILKGKNDTERSTETSLASEGAAGSSCGGAAAGSPSLEPEQKQENQAGKASGGAGTTRIQPRGRWRAQRARAASVVNELPPDHLRHLPGFGEQALAAVSPPTEAPEAADASSSTSAAAASAPTRAIVSVPAAEAVPAAATLPLGPVTAAASVAVPSVAVDLTSAAQNPVKAVSPRVETARTVVYMRGQRKHSFEGKEPGALGEEIAKVFGVPPDEQHLLQEAKTAHGDAFFCLERKMDARRLHFTQAHISPTFRNGQQLFQLLNEINNGGFDPLRELDPLDVVHFEGKWWSMDNRRLWVLKHCEAAFAGSAVWVRVNVQRLDGRFRERYTTSNGGIAVCITRSRSPSPTSRGGVSDTTTVSSFS